MYQRHRDTVQHCRPSEAQSTADPNGHGMVRGAPDEHYTGYGGAWDALCSRRRMRRLSRHCAYRNAQPDGILRQLEEVNDGGSFALLRASTLALTRLPVRSQRFYVYGPDQTYARSTR
jgi:hypothetical protein